MFTIATFYRFVELENYQDMQDVIKEFCSEQKIKGTILLAEEGINATISATTSAMDNFFTFMSKDFRLADLKWKKSYAQYQPFERMKVRLKKEIVALGVSNLNMNNKGKYISPEDWDDFISQDDVLLIDTRNTYEIKLGRFNNSVNPKTYNFRDFPSWVKQLKISKKTKIAMYCTGGVRCEKSTAYMKQSSFNNVYHLEGGILNYLKQTKNKKKNWSGDCFVFDDRIAVDDFINPSENIKCTLCGNEVSTDDLKSVTAGKVICENCHLLKNNLF
ncbi:MAG: rhodanese-related sulfurtransferase [Rickettsiaceae bacterium H1]|nr:rhodanese-related sulfurtransferase [Rickettsiaceae bacterium H1]